jgi:hypothetical protein
VPLPISRSATDALGRRLAAADEISDDDAALLLQVLDAYQAAENEVQTRLRALGYAATSRTKTTGVLIEKLRREKSSLKSVQDVAGARIVCDGDRDLQDETVAAVVSAFSDGTRAVKIRDRRVEPSHGYRAVHIVVSVQDLPVEIQVRTKAQDQWAQIVESLGDRWGRGIRYGQPPPAPETVLIKTPSATITRGELWQLVTGLSDAIHALEQLQCNRNELVRDWELLEGRVPEDELAVRRQDHDDALASVAEQESRIGQLLAVVAQFAEGI